MRRRDQHCLDQPDLFDAMPQGGSQVSTKQLTRTEHPETSHDAADRLVSTGSLQQNESDALAMVKRYPGKTGYELDAIDKNNNRRISKRLGGLKNKGLIKRGDSRRCGINNSNCGTWWPV